MYSYHMQSRQYIRVVDDWSKRYLYCVEHRSKAVHVYGSSLKQTPFGWVKEALSAGASSMIIQLTGEEFYSWYIWWLIIGGVHCTF